MRMRRIAICNLFSDTLHSVWLFWTGDQPQAEISAGQHTTIFKRQISMPPGGFEPRSPSKLATAEPRLRPRGYRVRLSEADGLCERKLCLLPHKTSQLTRRTRHTPYVVRYLSGCMAIRHPGVKMQGDFWGEKIYKTDVLFYPKSVCSAAAIFHQSKVMIFFSQYLYIR
jgi:hypothetical protein